jgi:hypothetical protein
MEDTIKRLLRIIPGYSGYETAENRRDADKTLRSHLARQYRSERKEITDLAQKAVQAQKFQHITRIDAIGKKLDHFIGRLESAPRGYAPWFSDVKIDQADLDQIYEFDARMTDSIPLLREHIDHVEKELRSGEQLDEALDALEDFITGLHTQFDSREQFTLQGKRPA